MSLYPLTNINSSTSGPPSLFKIAKSKAESDLNVVAYPFSMPAKNVAKYLLDFIFSSKFWDFMTSYNDALKVIFGNASINQLINSIC